MSTRYRHAMESARRDAEELAALLERSGDRTILELMTAIGLATMVHEALLCAAKARVEQDAAEG